MSAKLVRQVIVSGAPVSVTVTPGTRFSRVVETALRASGNRGGTGTAWELRRVNGDLLDPAQRITDADGWREDEALYLNPSAGIGAAPSPEVVDGFPRRSRVYLFTAPERAIYDAVQAVEEAGAHPRLTDAVVLLAQARDAVADGMEALGRTARAALSGDTKDAARYRALRSSLIAWVGEDGELDIGCTVLRSDGGPTEEPITERAAPFLTADERDELNGTKPHGTGNMRGGGVIDRIVDHLVAELA